MSKLLKSNDVELAERRESVQRLRLNGLNYKSISQVLGISVDTVARDLRSIAEENTKRLDNFNQNEEIAKALETLNEVERKAWESFISAPRNSNLRLKSLDLVRNVVSDKLKALQDCGLIKKEDKRVEISHKFELPWNDEVKEQVALALLNTTMTTRLAEPVIDATIVEENNDALIEEK